MNININGLNINYQVYGESGKDSIILLHGWGANLKTVECIALGMKDRFRVYSIDLPGFGSSDMPSKDYNVSKYASIVYEFINKLDIKNYILIGHSFGGRIITKLVGQMGAKPKKIVYIDAASVKPKRSIVYYFKVYSYKTVKFFIKLLNNKEKADEIINRLRKNVGSDDYKNANDNLKSIFINVVNEDLTHLFKNIDMPTLLIWGENDNDTPVSDAKIFEKNIKDSGLVILKGAGHYSYIDKYNEFIIILRKFLEGDN